MNKDSSGFTLIELMVVVGIIGILVSIAGPQFAKYRSKTLQSEAKLALSAVYSLEKAFYTEYGSYVASFDAIGFQPEGSKRFYAVGWDACSNAGVISGFAGSIGSCFYSQLNNSGLATSLQTDFAGQYPNPTDTNPQTFLVTAYGVLRSGGPADLWNMTHLKTLSNSYIGL